MSRKAIIDIGSNSIKFFVGELAEDKTIKGEIILKNKVSGWRRT